MHTWVGLSLAALLANTFKIFIVKRGCQAIDSRLVVLSGRVVSAVVLLPFLWIAGNGFPTDGLFWLVTAATSLLTVVANILLTDAVKHGRLTVVMPTQAVVPVFSLLTLAVFWKELPSCQSIILMCLSMAAVAWTIYTDTRNQSGHRGWIWVVYSLTAAAIYGVSTILDRVAIVRVVQGGLAYSACWNLLSAGLMAIEALRYGSFKTASWNASIIPLLLYSAMAMTAFLTQQWAVQLSQHLPGAVVEVKSIVILHLPLVIAAGWLSEPPIRLRRLIPALAAAGCGILLVRSMMS